MPPIATSILRSYPFVQLLVQPPSGVLDPRRVCKTRRRLHYILLMAVAADAFVRIIRRDDVDLLPTVQAVHLVLQMH